MPIDQSKGSAMDARWKARGSENLLLTLWALFQPRQKIRFTALVATSTIGSLLDLLAAGSFLFLIQYVLFGELPTGIVNAVHAYLCNDFFLQSKNRLVVLLSVFVCTVLTLRLAVAIFLLKLRVSFSWNVLDRLSNLYFSSVIRGETSNWFQLTSADFLSDLTKTCDRVALGIVNSGLLAISGALTSFALMMAVAWAEPIAFFVTAGSLSLSYALVFLYTNNKLKLNGRRETAVYAAYAELALESARSHREIKIYGQEGAVINEHSARLSKRAEVSLSNRLLSEVPQPVMQALFAFVFLGVIVLLSSVLQVDTAGQSLLLISIFSLQLLPALNRLYGSVSNIISNLPALERLLSFITGEVSQVSESTRRLTMKETLDLDNIYYTYPTRMRPALAGVRFRLRAGEALGVIGPSGSGKSTLLEVVSSLIEPAFGQMRVDGCLINEANRTAWMRSIGYVSQATFLMNDSIRNNIFFGRARDDYLLDKAVHMAGLAETLEQLEEGLDTKVGEGGRALSGGQRQRVGIARALYDNPSLLLLDEAASALDPESSTAMVEQLTSLRGKVSIIAVSHQMDFLRFCDRVVAVKDGQLFNEAELRKASK